MKPVPTTLAEMSRSIPERVWQRTVVSALRVHGWRVYWTWSSVHSPSGFPDLVCCHPQHGVVFCELKKETGRLTPDQESWRDTLVAAGQRHYVWRPSDWLEVVAVSGGAVPGGGRDQAG